MNMRKAGTECLEQARTPGAKPIAGNAPRIGFAAHSLRACAVEWQRPWKLLTLAIGVALLIAGAHLYQAPDWDVPISFIMAILAYLTAPWSLRTLIERRWRDWPLMLFLTWFTVDGCYAIYWHFRDPLALELMRDANFPASLSLYWICGLLWLYPGPLRQMAADALRLLDIGEAQLVSHAPAKIGKEQHQVEPSMTKTTPDDQRRGPPADTGKAHYDQVDVWLEANDYAYAQYPDDRYFSLRQAGDAGDWRVIVDVREGQGGSTLLIYSIYSIKVPPGRRSEASELVTRVNANLRTGSFELDWETGEVRVRTSMPILDSSFTDTQFSALFYANLALADRYLAGVCGVAFGNVTPALAIEMAQVPARDSLQ
jgi:hypothetical protein